MNPKREGWLSGGDSACDPVPPLPERAYRLVLLGPPGVGKGTQAKLLGNNLQACHLSTGDLFRSATCEGTSSPAMKQALAAMQRGELVSDEIVIAMVGERTQCLRCRGGFLLDGFPRTVGQAEALDQMLVDLNIKLDAAICFQMPLEKIIARLSGRRTCSSCQAVFHVTSKPPEVLETCDHCHSPLTHRDDDQPAAIQVHMQVYEKETQPLIDYYQQNGKLKIVEAVGTPQEILNRSLRLLGQDRYSAA